MNLQEREISGIFHFFWDIPVFRVGKGNTHTSPDFANPDIMQTEPNNEVTKMTDKPLLSTQKLHLWVKINVCDVQIAHTSILPEVSVFFKTLAFLFV